MPSCCIKGCRWRQGKEPEHLFRVPKDAYLLEQWKKIIPKEKKDLKLSICSRHFKEEDIERYHHGIGPDGMEWRFERDRVCLKKGAIPCIIEPVREELSYVQNEEFILPDINDDDEKNISPVIKIQLPVSSLGYNSSIIEYMKPHTDQQLDSFSFNELKKRKDEIIENSSWTTTVSDEFIGYLYWASNFTVQKHVIIFKDLKIKVFFNGQESKMFEDIAVESLRSLAIILHIVVDTKSNQ